MHTLLTTLQSLIWPEIGLSTERDLYVRLTGSVGLSLQERALHFISGGHAAFNTYYNLFNTGKWVKNCALESLFLTLDGEGQFEVVIFHASPNKSYDRLVNEVITLEAGAALPLRLDTLLDLSTRGVVFFELRALSERAYLRNAYWQTADAPERTPDLMLSITTFRREQAVAKTVARFEEFIACSALSQHIHLTVVDNGQSAEVSQSEHVTLILNENLGGSGGFARGLLEAQSRGASHCLFMDDDASVHMEAIERTWMFLAYARDPQTAVAGAVSDAEHRWKLWENGARFDHICRPEHMGLDLRNPNDVFNLEFDSTAKRPENFYGGWWYFAFPVEKVQHMPFPFFVRGDDVSFSLVHDFNIVTLAGVISYQEEDFSIKETPLTVYLDLRSHLVHHLSLPKMEIGRKGILKIMARFYLRSLLLCHYETLTAVGLAMQDVLAGPEYFSTNADMSARRKQIGQMTEIERWKPEEQEAPKRPDPRTWLSPHHMAPRFFMKITLNGHLLPGFRLIGNRIIHAAVDRGQIRPAWGAKALTYLSTDGKRSYTVRHSKRQALAATLPVLRAAWATWINYEKLRDTWREGYEELTQRGYWEKSLKIRPQPSRNAKTLRQNTS